MCVSPTAGLSMTGLAAVTPGLPSEPERAGDPSMRDKVVVQWGGAPSLSFSSLLVYRVEYSLAGVFDGSMDSGSEIVSETYMEAIVRGSDIISESTAWTQVVILLVRVQHGLR